METDLCSPGLGRWHRLLPHMAWLLPGFQAEALPGLMLPSSSHPALEEQRNSSSFSGLPQPGTA